MDAKIINVEFDEFVKNLKSSKEVIDELSEDISNCLKLGSSLVTPFNTCESFDIVEVDYTKVVLKKHLSGELLTFNGVGCDCLKGCTKVLICLFSLGKAISGAINDYFKQDDTVNAMLLDIYSNLCLSKYCVSVLEDINKANYPQTAKLSLELGTNVFEISELPKVFQTLNQDVVTLSNSLVMTPQKSLAYIIGMSENTQNQTGTTCKLHDCEKCTAKQCPYRQDVRYKLNVVNDFGTDAIEVKKNTTILEALRTLGVTISAPCNKNHTCGNCKILVQNPKPPTKTDLSLISSDLIKQGYRLSCDYLITENTTVYVSRVKSYALTNALEISTTKNDALLKQITENGVTSYYIGETKLGSFQDEDLYTVAIDLGSTTIAAYLTNIKTNEMIDVMSISNPQVSFGADVISRVNFAISNINGSKILHDATILSLNNLINSLISKNSVTPSSVILLAICGNTIMQHIVCGDEIKSFGSSPFTPVFLEEQLIGSENLGLNYGKKVLIAPSISSFVGADITCGILTAREHIKNTTCNYNHYNILIDLGTNAEIALFSDSEILTTSAAAGPSLEGGEISYGMAAQSGAIYDIKLSRGKVLIEYFGDKPTGVCGSGILKLVASLITNNLIDFSGKFSPDGNNEYSHLISNDKFTICEGITFSGADIRKIQLAKAAIAAAIKTLIKEADVQINIIDNIFVGGGFGNYADLDSLFTIGLLTEEFRGKAVKLGNTAASGIIAISQSEKIRQQGQIIASTAKSVDLSSNTDFTNEFMDCILFPE